MKFVATFKLVFFTLCGLLFFSAVSISAEAAKKRSAVAPKKESRKSFFPDYDTFRTLSRADQIAVIQELKNFMQNQENKWKTNLSVINGVSFLESLLVNQAFAQEPDLEVGGCDFTSSKLNSEQRTLVSRAPKCMKGGYLICLQQKNNSLRCDPDEVTPPKGKCKGEERQCRLPYLKKNGDRVCADPQNSFTQACGAQPDLASADEVAKFVEQRPDLRGEWDSVMQDLSSYCGLESNSKEVWSFDQKDCDDFRARLKGFKPVGTLPPPTVTRVQELKDREKVAPIGNGIGKCGEPIPLKQFDPQNQCDVIMETPEFIIQSVHRNGVLQTVYKDKKAPHKLLKGKRGWLDTSAHDSNRYAPPDEERISDEDKGQIVVHFENLADEERRRGNRHPSANPNRLAPSCKPVLERKIEGISLGKKCTVYGIEPADFGSDGLGVDFGSSDLNKLDSLNPNFCFLEMSGASAGYHKIKGQKENLKSLSFENKKTFKLDIYGTGSHYLFAEVKNGEVRCWLSQAEEPTCVRQYVPMKPSSDSPPAGTATSH